MSLTVRRVGQAHLDLLAALHATAFEEPWSAMAIGQLLATPGAFALLATRRAPPATLGFILCRTGGGECEVLTLAVASAARRQGVGGTLLRAATRAAAEAGAAVVLLEVAADNAPAQALYAAHGFATVGRRPASYQRASGGRADALVMRRPLLQANN